MKNPDIITKMKIQMLKLQSEMIKEGGDWYSNHQFTDMINSRIEIIGLK